LDLLIELPIQPACVKHSAQASEDGA